MPNILITGANRGIGLEFARQYKALGWHVIATCRHPQTATDLNALDVSVRQLDVDDFDAIARLAVDLSGTPLDVVINNAGIYGGEGQELGRIDAQAWAATLHTNVMAPLKIAEAFAESMTGRKVMAFLSSKMGSIAENSSGGTYLYRSSKAALNAVIKSLSIDLAGRGITCLALHPGWVRTAMGGPNALITPEQSVAGLLQVIDQAKPDQSGRFVDYAGKEIPW